MNLEQIRKQINEGFKPFVLRTSDGREFPVPYQDFIFLTKQLVVVADKDGLVDVLDPLHVVSLRELQKSQ